MERVLRAKYQLERLVPRLLAEGFQFDRPAEVLPRPEPETAAAIARIEQAVGRLPFSLKLFWEHIGSVDLSGSHPGWTNCDYLDQLVVFPASLALYELDEFLADAAERLAADYPYAVPIAPDIFHKANVSGGMPYLLAVPTQNDDPLLMNAEGGRSFLGHVEHALAFAGFPGLAQCQGHDWPVRALLSDDG